ncbi:MFS transporter [Halosegnis sp.]|uniref:MFS transporter n=1 Tax=Halosegnis sp. TaxID=2864959 RepID=UPI0035D4F771
MVRRPSLDAIRGFDHAVYVVAGGQLVNVFGAGLVYPFATVHFHLEVGIALAVVGLGLGAKSVATGVGTAVGGYLADAVGRRPVMVVSMAAAAFALSAYAAVPALAALVPGALVQPVGVSRLGAAFVGVSVVAGLVGGLYTPAAQALLADLTAESERDRGYALLKVANNAGFGAGFVAGGLLYSVASVAVFVADGATSGLVALLLIAFVPRATGGTDGEETGANAAGAFGRWLAAVREPRVLVLAGLNVGFAIMYAQMQATVPVVAKAGLGLSPVQLGTLYTLNPLTIVLFQLPVVAAVDDWRRTRGLTLSALLWGVSMGAALLADIGVGPVLAGVAFVGTHLVVRTLGEILHAPLVTSLTAGLGEASERGTHLSVVEVAKRVGIGAGSFLGGLFFDAGLATLWWLMLAGVCLLLAAALVGFERLVTPAENGAVG